MGAFWKESMCRVTLGQDLKAEEPAVQRSRTIGEHPGTGNWGERMTCAKKEQGTFCEQLVGQHVAGRCSVPGRRGEMGLSWQPGATAGRAWRATAGGLDFCFHWCSFQLKVLSWRVIWCCFLWRIWGTQSGKRRVFSFFFPGTKLQESHFKEGRVLSTRRLRSPRWSGSLVTRPERRQSVRQRRVEESCSPQGSRQGWFLN